MWHHLYLKKKKKKLSVLFNYMFKYEMMWGEPCPHMFENKDICTFNLYIYQLKHSCTLTTKTDYIWWLSHLFC